ncbi:MAG: hypothetical protein R3214_03375 [Christiangramia sp.]|nr:hypothetical protein [Christiangramia sp.]
MSRFPKNWSVLILLGMCLLVFSCSESDDLDITGEDPGIGKELPVTDDSTSDDETPTDDGSSTDDENSADDDPSTDDGTSVDDDSTTDDETPIEDETSTNPDSSIIYTDIKPDFVVENIIDSYDLDLNNDKIADFIISNRLYENWDWLGITAIRHDGIISVEPWYTHAVPIERDSEIFYPVNPNTGQHYARAGIIAIEACFVNEEGLGCSYDWAGKNDKYLGLQIKIDGQMHYGWLRMEVANVGEWVIKDYAFNSIPNMPILAGQME